MANIILLGLFTVFVTIVTYKLRKFIYKFYRIYKYTINLPGLPGLPLIGNAHQLNRDSNSGFLIQVMDIFKTCCDYKQIGRILIGPYAYVILPNAESITEVMQSSKYLAKAKLYNILQDWLGDGLLLSKGSKWKQRRRLITPSFHFTIIDEFLDIFNEQADILLNLLEKKAAHGKTFDVTEFINNCMLDVLCETAMGVRVEAQTKPSAYAHSMHHLTEMTMDRLKNPIYWLPNWLYGFTSHGKLFLRLVNDSKVFTRKVIEERKASIDGDESEYKPKRKAFLDMMLETDLDGVKLSVEDIQEEVDTFMFEGHDTTATAACFALYNLARHPDIQEKVYQEINDIIGEKPYIDKSDVTKLKYLECCIKESLRLMPSVPVIARDLEEDVTVNSTFIPKGSFLIVFPYCLHRDPKYFMDPELFDPDRFLPENVIGRHPFAYIPFSAGPRNCIGQKFAMKEEKIVVAKVIQKFRLSSEQTVEELKISMGIILKADNGVKLTFTLRD